MLYIKLIIFSLFILWASESFGACTWVLWQSKWGINTNSLLQRNEMFLEKNKEYSYTELKSMLEDAFLSERWSFIDAFDTKEQCMEAKKEQITKLYDVIKLHEKESTSDNSQTDVSLKDGVVYESTTKKDYMAMAHWKHQCIPDTIDPR